MKNHQITNMHDLEHELSLLHEKLGETEFRIDHQWEHGKRNFLRLCLNSVKCKRGTDKGTEPLFAGVEFIKEIAVPLWKNFLEWVSQKFKR